MKEEAPELRKIGAVTRIVLSDPKIEHRGFQFLTERSVEALPLNGGRKPESAAQFVATTSCFPSIILHLRFPLNYGKCARHRSLSLRKIDSLIRLYRHRAALRCARCEFRRGIEDSARRAYAVKDPRQLQKELPRSHGRVLIEDLSSPRRPLLTLAKRSGNFL